MFGCGFKKSRAFTIKLFQIVVQTMPLRSGFQGQVDCPLWLLSRLDVTIIPLGKGRQSNPIYSRRPGQGGEMLAAHCSIEVIAKRFEYCTMGNMTFVAAEVDMPEYDLEGWINIWQGRHTRGTLYCALKYDGDFCLCGTCTHSWVRQGWVCEVIWANELDLGIEY